MSRSKQLIINCGASRITAAVVSSSGGAPQIEKLVTEILNYDYFTIDDVWLGAVGVALHTLHHRHKFSGNASFVIPGNQVLTKTIRIPHVEESKRAQIIAFEAQQNIPYPLHEVVWDSQVVGMMASRLKCSLSHVSRIQLRISAEKLPVRVFSRYYQQRRHYT